MFFANTCSQMVVSQKKFFDGWQFVLLKLINIPYWFLLIVLQKIIDGNTIWFGLLKFL
jgi:hypothetical protein